MTVNNQNTAFVVIDMLSGWTETEVPDSVHEAINKAVELVKTARKNEFPIIFSNDAHREGIDRELNLWGIHSIAGTPGAQPVAAFEPRESDFTVPKRRYSGFFQTDLDLLLRELGIDTVVLLGMDTNICVQHTAADAFFLNYEVVVASDGTVSFLVGDQETGLEYMRTCYAASILSCDELMVQIQH